MSTVSRKLFLTPQEVQDAFYTALERGDLEAMMEVWAEDDEIVCVHPAGPRLSGPAQVRQGWAAIFTADRPVMRVHVTQQVQTMASALFAVHSVRVTVLVESRNEVRGPIVATNVFQRTPEGWRMILHHASPAPGKPDLPAAADEKILH